VVSTAGADSLTVGASRTTVPPTADAFFFDAFVDFTAGLETDFVAVSTTGATSASTAKVSSTAGAISATTFSRTSVSSAAWAGTATVSLDLLSQATRPAERKRAAAVVPAAIAMRFRFLLVIRLVFIVFSFCGGPRLGFVAIQSRHPRRRGHFSPTFFEDS